MASALPWLPLIMFAGLISAASGQLSPSLPRVMELMRHYMNLGEDNVRFMVPFLNHVGTGRRMDNIWDALAVEPRPRLYNVSEECYNGTERVVQGLLNGEPWAIRVLDASGKLGSGVMTGNLHWWGAFTECQGLVEQIPIYNSTSVPPTVENVFEGVPCTALIANASVPIPEAILGMSPASALELGVCVPSACSTEDVAHLVNNLLVMFPEDYQASKVTCRPAEPLAYDTPAIIMMSVLCIIGAIIFIATMYDLLVIHRGWAQIRPRSSTETLPMEGDVRPAVSEILRAGDYVPLGNSPRDDMDSSRRSTFSQLMASFSVYTNGAKLLSTERTSTSLDAVHGIRFISMTWVMLGHTYVFGLGVITNAADIFSFLKTWHFQAVGNALVSVDSFFLLSGMLLGYLLLKEMDSKGGPLKINWLKFYFHRFWRLTPPYMLVMGAEVALFKYWGTGPMWPSETGIDKTCGTDWWANLLYVNNLVRDHMGCMAWTWYLANDMQFFIISPLFIIPFYLNWIAGLVVTLVMLMISTIVIAVITVQNHYGAELISVMFQPQGIEVWKYFQDVYVTPWCRIGPYLIGIIYGYLIFKTKRQVRIHWAFLMLGWLMAAASALAVLYGLYGEANGHAMSTSVSAFYASVHRTVWGLAVGWVVFACVTGNGGWVNDFLSWRPFIPLSRLTYMAYLVHPVVIAYFYSSLKTPVFFETLTVVYFFLSNVVLSYGVAFIASVSFESPMMGLEKVLLRR